jgi:hypothetical protein
LSPWERSLEFLDEDLAQHTKDGFTFSHTHAKQKQKEYLKLQTPKTILRKPKERGKKTNNKKKILNFKNKRNNKN